MNCFNGGQKKLRISIILVLMLMLLASNAYGFGSSGSVVVDIVGSKTDNTKVASHGTDKVELEIVGSTANNTVIGLPEEKKEICCGCPYPDKKCICPEDKRKCPEDKKPWDNMHLGVDAWYDTFWYMNDINMPQWPQI
jgi:hypothetical protein